MAGHKKHVHGGKSSRDILDAGFIMESWGPQSGDSVCDVGCGDGYLALAAARAVGPAGVVYGLDVHAESLESAGDEARAHGLDTVSFMAADATEGIPLPDGSIDFMIMANVLHGFIENDELEPIMAGVSRVLKGGGQIDGYRVQEGGDARRPAGGDSVETSGGSRGPRTLWVHDDRMGKNRRLPPPDHTAVGLTCKHRHALLA